MFPAANYRGRFAPSPTGALHFGSLAAALASYLDAKHHQGIWLVRMEDLVAPRVVHGAADNILRTRETFGLHWDEAVLYQSRRSEAYEAALQTLQRLGMAYRCCCTRKEIADSVLHGIEGAVYPGTCRNGIAAGRVGRAWRVRTDNLPVAFNDVVQGRITQRLESEIGDFVVRRADGVFAYQLAVVVDDAFQRITHVVRGADLLNSTPRQIWLQRLLGLPLPCYLHIPVAVNAEGEKLSKQTLAEPVAGENAAGTLFEALAFLQQHPPVELRGAPVQAVLQWGVENWRRSEVRNQVSGDRRRGE
jgi:glutamyl-Q tRNA(Asp) synthetase